MSSTATFRYQARSCNSTGCSSWQFRKGDELPKSVHVELGIFGGTAYVSFITGRCTAGPQGSCSKYSRIPIYDHPYDVRVRIIMSLTLLISFT